jgi:POT family proton-dependent oligopeptide transporter
LLGYLLHTTGELCLSPVGLSMIVKLSPKILVSTVMGMWFLATAFSQYLAGMIAMLTSVDTHSGGESNGIPIPRESLHIYGDLYLKIAVAAIISAMICLALSPVLKYWMHEEATVDPQTSPSGQA